MKSGIQNVIQPAGKKAAAKKKPLRGRATPQTPGQKAETPVLTSVARRDAAHANTARPERVPVAANYEKLAAVAMPYRRDGYHLRFFRDDPGRLEQALSAHYVFVTDDFGNNVTYQKGLRKMHLMELPNHLWEEEIALLNKRIHATVQSDAQIGDDQYVPQGKTGPLSVDMTDD